MTPVFWFFLPVIAALILVALLAFPWSCAILGYNRCQPNNSALALPPEPQSCSLAGEWFLDCALTHLRNEAAKPEYENDKELAAIIVVLESALTEVRINLWVGNDAAIEMSVAEASDKLVKYSETKLKKQQIAVSTATTQ